MGAHHGLLLPLASSPSDVNLGGPTEGGFGGPLDRLTKFLRLLAVTLKFLLAMSFLHKDQPI